MSLITPQVSDQELRPFVEKILREQGEDAHGLTVDDVLHSKMCRGLKSLAVLSWQNEQKKLEAERRAEEARRQAELNKQKAEQVSKIEAKLREQLGLKSLAPEELKEQLRKSAKSESETANNEQSSWVPANVAGLAEKFGEILPAFVFKNDEQAVTFRGWLGFWNNECKNALSRSDLSPEYRQALTERGEKIRALMSATTSVVAAWGLDPKTARTQPKDFYEMRSHLEVEGGRFYWLTQKPAVETPENDSARQEAEAMANAEEEAKQKQWAALKDSLKAGLLEVDSTLSADSAEKLAKRLAKKYGELSDAKTVFRTAAVNRMAMAGDNESEQLTAKRLAKAGGMTEQEFELEVRAYAQVYAAEAQAAADKKARQLKDPNYGAIKSSTIIAAASRKNSKKKADGKKNGQKNGK